jgi:ketosteroid isomerase-like protein
MSLDTEATRAVVERYAAAWASGDFGRVADSYHERMVLHWFGAHPLAGVHEGKAAALAALAGGAQKVRRTLVAVEHILADGHRALLVARERFERDGRTAEVTRLLYYRVEDDRLRECWVYDQDQSLIDSFLA